MQRQQQFDQQWGGMPPAPAAPAAPATYDDYKDYVRTTVRDGQFGIGGVNPPNPPTANSAASSSSPSPSPSWHTRFSPTTTIPDQNSFLSSDARIALDNFTANAPVSFTNALPASTHRQLYDGLPPVSTLPGIGDGDGGGGGSGDGDGFPSTLTRVENHWVGKVSPSPSFQSHGRPDDAGRSSLLAAAPAYQHPSSNLSTENGLRSLPAPAPAPSPSATATATATASTNLTAAASGIAGATGGSTSQNATSTAGPTTVPPSHVPSAPVGVGQQPSASVARPSEGYGGLGRSSSSSSSSRPVLKMKRTGQNFPLASPAPLHQRNSSYSPTWKLGPTLANSAAARKSSEPVPSTAADSLLAGRQPSAQPPKTGVENGIEKAPSAGPFNKPGGTSTTETQHARRFPGAAGPTGLLPRVVHAPKPKSPGSMSTTSASKNESDDEIMYETAAGPQYLFTEAPQANDSSSNDSDSESDEDDTLEVDPSGRQLFRAPEQESDGYDGDETEEDDSTSVSSSQGSSIADEPSVALPSANIQQQEAYPATIRTMANPDRPYTTWPEHGVLLKASPAIFPDSYQKSTEIKGFPWICAVRSCRLTYKTSAGLRNHFRLSHKKARLNDNMDGTLSLIGFYTKRNNLGLYPPVVVSKRPLDPNEPPMVPTTIPIKARMRIVPAHSSLDGEDTIMGNVDTGSVEPQELPPPLSTADPRNSEEMWEYIRPHLKVHNSLPVKNWSRHVAHLPRVREIQWNEERNIDHPFKDSHPRDVTALIVQVTGVEAPTPCDFCAQGKGPFIGCITVSPEASSEARAAVLSCANCYYHCRQSTCSLCSDAIIRRERRARIQQQPESYNVKRLSDAVRHRPAAERTAQSQAASLLTKSAANQAYARPKPKVYEPSEINNIEMADESRTYKVIKGKNGENILMHGALIPDHYDLDRTFPGYPWICPVRSCRFVFKRIANLGSHFVMKHRGCLFNDNRNGTLSLVGYYHKPLPGEKTAPALIVSQNALDETEPPMLQASLPGSANLEKEARPKTGPKVAGGSTVPSLTGNAKRLWDYMLGFLPESPGSLVFDPQIMRLFGLSRRRDVQWRMTWDRRRLDDDRYQILGLLLYLTGERYERDCTNCRRGQGPFPGCFLLPKEVGNDLHRFARSCANCHFMHNKHACSIKPGRESRIGDEGAATANKKRRLSGADYDEALAYPRRSDRFVGRDSEDKAAPERKIVTLSLHPKGDGPTLGSGGAMPRRTTTAAGIPSSTAASSGLISAGQVQPDDLLEMEDWEIAPGRIRETGAARIDNIAFSKSYLEANQAVQVSPDVHFEVKTIKSGNSLQLEADSTKARYCSLASGKLHIRVEEQAEFTIGPHGLFKIKPGLKAWVQNRLYVDSVLHIASHKEC